jgi:hypothetical protein
VSDRDNQVVVSGVKMQNMVEDKADFRELMELENENFALD